IVGAGPGGSAGAWGSARPAGRERAYPVPSAHLPSPPECSPGAGGGRQSLERARLVSVGAIHDDLAGGAEPAGLERRPAWAVASGFGVGRPASAPVREDP